MYKNISPLNTPAFLSFQNYDPLFFYHFVSSSKPKALGELIVYAGSIVRRRPSVFRPISNDYSYETTGPVVTRFHIQPPVPLDFCMGKSELVTVAALGLNWLNKLMKLNEYQRSRSFFGLGQTSHNFRIKTCTPKKTFRLVDIKFHLTAKGRMGIKSFTSEFGHMTKLAAMHIYGKNFENLILQGQLTDDLET